MRTRSANKIVNRVLSGTVTAQSYPRGIVATAFAQLGVDLTANHLKPWTDADAKKERLKAEAVLQAPKTAARKVAKEERLRLRAKAADTKRTRIRTLEFERKIKEADETAAAAARDAFDEAIENIKTGTPESMADGVPDLGGEFHGAGPPDTTYPKMSVKDLKAECKARGLTNYSSLKRPGLTAMLVANDNT